jgi:hypothetical protein
VDRARAVSATPTSSDGASATAKSRKTRGSILHADRGQSCTPIDIAELAFARGSVRLRSGGIQHARQLQGRGTMQVRKRRNH